MNLTNREEALLESSIQVAIDLLLLGNVKSKRTFGQYMMQRKLGANGEAKPDIGETDNHNEQVTELLDLLGKYNSYYKDWRTWENK